jgi:hypothetical protein
MRHMSGGAQAAALNRRAVAVAEHSGDRTSPHRHPDSTMVTLSSFRRRLVSNAREREVEFDAGQATWLAEQGHTGENIGDTDTHVIFVELKEPPSSRGANPPEPLLGPSLTQ